jgi:hypothetical protein
MKLALLVLLVTFLSSMFLILVDVSVDVPIYYQARLVAMLTIIVSVILFTRIGKTKDNW